MAEPKSERVYNILFLCTGNSARSIMAESLVNSEGGSRFRAFSAGSHPKGEVHPMALEVLRSLRLPTEGVRSKSWEEFAAPDAPRMDFIFTVCDDAAGEQCPAWPGNPVTASWGISDPAAVEGPGQKQAFAAALQYLKNRFSLFSILPLEAIDRMTIEAKVKAIGRSDGATPKSLENNL